VKRIVLASFGDARDEIDRVQLEMELSNKSANGVELVMAPALDAMKMALQAELPRVLLQTHNETAAKAYKLVQSKVAQPRAAAAAAPVKVKQAFDVTDPAAVAWVQAHAAELIDGITDTTREDIKRLIESAFEDQFDVYDLADQIAEVIGDDARAEEIARTETMTASNVGQQDAWDQAVDDGLLTGDEVQEWIVTPDDRLCPICEGLEGVQAGLGEMFAADGEQYDGPPAHPNCRCTVGLALPS
jgi:hypothetical protein